MSSGKKLEEEKSSFEKVVRGNWQDKEARGKGHRRSGKGQGKARQGEKGRGEIVDYGWVELE